MHDALTFDNNVWRLLSNVKASVVLQRRCLELAPLHLFEEGGALDVGVLVLRGRQRVVEFSAVAALRSFREWLERDLLPRSNGDFAIGVENFRKKLLYEEMIDTPTATLSTVTFAPGGSVRT